MLIKLETIKLLRGTRLIALVQCYSLSRQAPEIGVYSPTRAIEEIQTTRNDNILPWLDRKVKGTLSRLEG